MNISTPADLNELLAPVWTGSLMYHESFLPLEPKDSTGGELKIPLLYPATEILSVTEATREHTFKEGQDYRLEDGLLVIPEASRIQKMPWKDYQIFGKDDVFPFACEGGGRLFFREGADLLRAQYDVTYRHESTWSGFVPKAQPDALPRVRALLAAGKPFCFGFMGDSITTGCNSSSQIQSPPDLPIFPVLTVQALEKQFGSVITYVNHAVGGTCSAWGCERIPLDFADEKPDLMFIGFGMNDASGRISAQSVRDNVRTMMEETLALRPDCEFLICSTTLPNPLAPGFVSDHDAHEPLLAELCREYGNRAALVPMTSVHKALLAKKRFWDMTGNNINHPNDFLARVYAQTILSVLVP